MKQGEYKFTGEIKQNFNVTFHNGEKQIGLLDFNGDAMMFEGEAEESAKLFFDCLARWFEKRLEEERKATKEKAAKVCDEKADSYGAIKDEWGNQQRITANLCAAAIRSMK